MWLFPCQSISGNDSTVYVRAYEPVSYTHLDVYKRQAVRCTYPVSALTSEDRDALLAFGGKLGSCSSTDQLRHIALVRERLRANEVKARDKAIETARMWRYLGLTVGAMIALMLY